MPRYSISLQDQIELHLDKIRVDDATVDTIQDKFSADCDFIIGAKYQPEHHIRQAANACSTTRYHEVFFTDRSLDELPAQAYSMGVIRAGVLAVTHNGKLKLVDSKLQPLDCNSKFVFEDGALKLELTDADLEYGNRRSCTIM